MSDKNKEAKSSVFRQMIAETDKVIPQHDFDITDQGLHVLSLHGTPNQLVRIAHPSRPDLAFDFNLNEFGQTNLLIDPTSEAQRQLPPKRVLEALAVLHEADVLPAIIQRVLINDKTIKKDEKKRKAQDAHKLKRKEIDSALRVLLSYPGVTLETIAELLIEAYRQEQIAALAKKKPEIVPAINKEANTRITNLDSVRVEGDAKAKDSCLVLVFSVNQPDKVSSIRSKLVTNANKKAASSRSKLNGNTIEVRIPKNVRFSKDSLNLHLTFYAKDGEGKKVKTGSDVYNLKSSEFTYAEPSEKIKMQLEQQRFLMHALESNDVETANVRVVKTAPSEGIMPVERMRLAGKIRIDSLDEVMIVVKRTPKDLEGSRELTIIFNDGYGKETVGIPFKVTHDDRGIAIITLPEQVKELLAQKPNLGYVGVQITDADGLSGIHVIRVNNKTTG